VVKPLGGAIVRRLGGQGWLLLLLAPAESSLYRPADIDHMQQQSWAQYALRLLWLSRTGKVALYALQHVQGLLSFVTRHFGTVPPEHRYPFRYQQELAILRVSDSTTTPNARAPSATTNGVAPNPATCATDASSSAGGFDQVCACMR
jgi:Potassium-transporting ATPase A subunit